MENVLATLESTESTYSDQHKQVTGSDLGTKRLLDVAIKEMYYLNSDRDQFGRQRVSQPSQLFESKLLTMDDDRLWATELNGTGASTTHVPNEACVNLEVGTASGEYAIRQTHRYFPYIPGKSQVVTMTGNLGEAKTNVVKRIGYFDDRNGLFFELAGDTLAVVRRYYTSGTVQEERVTQANWNTNKLDGTELNGITFDHTKSQIFSISFQWLGVGQATFSVNIGGKYCDLHSMQNANVIDTTYMSTPTLPARYEIRNTGVAASSSQLKQICTSVVSEGGSLLPGYAYSANSGITARSVTTRTPVLAVRLKNSLSGQPNRRSLQVNNFEVFVETNNAFIELVHVRQPTSVTATWTDVATESGAEFSTDVSAITPTAEQTITTVFSTAGQAGKGATEGRQTLYLENNSIISQNYDSTLSDIFVIYATSFTGTSDIRSAMGFFEYE